MSRRRRRNTKPANAHRPSAVLASAVSVQFAPVPSSGVPIVITDDDPERAKWRAVWSKS